MASYDIDEVRRLIKAARKKARGYANHFGWAIDRDIEEWGVATALKESLDKTGDKFFHNIRRRGRGNDPPDCEADLICGGRVALEVTELVDGNAIQDYKAGHTSVWAEWNSTALLEGISRRLKSKDKRKSLKGGPYEAYIVIIHTDEPVINYAFAQPLLKSHRFGPHPDIDRAFFLISYDPEDKRSPCIELQLK